LFSDIFRFIFQFLSSYGRRQSLTQQVIIVKPVVLSLTTLRNEIKGCSWKNVTDISQMMGKLDAVGERKLPPRQLPFSTFIIIISIFNVA